MFYLVSTVTICIAFHFYSRRRSGWRLRYSIPHMDILVASILKSSKSQNVIVYVKSLLRLLASIKLLLFILLTILMRFVKRNLSFVRQKRLDEYRILVTSRFLSSSLMLQREVRAVKNVRHHWIIFEH